MLETSVFTRRADALLSRDERVELINLLATGADIGDVTPGTGGVRKVRFAAGGQGKRGAFRVVYYAGGGELPVLLAAVSGFRALVERRKA